MTDKRLQTLWDHHEIRELLATYCHGCDRDDPVEMASTYCLESWDDHGPNKCDGREFVDLILAQSRKSSRVVSHQLGQSQITVDGDRAGAETYFIATCVFPREDGPDILNQLGGRYVDTLEREDGAWKIKERLCVREWSCSNPIESDWLAGAGFIESRRDAKDVSWDVLGKEHSGRSAVSG
ncbi:MAG: nuclear transport factor 2 family protein [Sphingomonadaceae bacterium]